MPYNKTQWQDEIPDLTKPILGSDGKQKTDPQTGRPLFELVQTGTRITSAKLNNIEDGIGAAHTLTEQLAAEVNGNFVASGMVFTFADLTASWTAGIAYVSGRRFDIAAGSLTLTAKQGQYIYMNVSGVIQKTTTEAIARAALSLWYFATDASKAITSTDMRRIITPDSYAFKADTVQKENGKGLSTNDYTDADKSRVQSHEDKLADLVPRLNTPTTTQLVLQPGLQTIQAARDIPFNLSSISGRMLLNLLGRAGTFDTTSGWSLTGGSGALSTTNALYGSNALLFTLSGASGRVSRSVTTVSGKRYLAAVEVRIGTAANAYVYVTGMSNGAPVNNTAGYTLTYVPFTANSTTTEIGVMINGANGQTAYIDGFRLYELPSNDYSLISNMTAVDVANRYPYTEGLAGVRNPYAIRWTSAAKTDVAAMLALDTELLAPPVPADDAERDRLELGVDGQYYKTSRWYKYVIMGSNLVYLTTESTSGYKNIRLKLPALPIKDSGFMIKFDGTVLGVVAQGVGTSAGDQHIVLDNTDSNANSLVLSVKSSDSGWGDNYTSITQDEVKAYFYGYKMYDSGTYTAAQAQAATSATYNGSGTKQWVNLVGTPVGSALPTTSAPGYTPYELIYKRAAIIAEPIASEGVLNLVQGDNTIEVGSGLILRETAKPQIAGDGYYYINGDTFISSALIKKPRLIIQIYKNNRFENWKTFGHADSVKPNLGLRQAQILQSDYDPSATYSVSYLPIQYYPVASFTGAIANNERAIIDELLRDVQQTVRRVSVMENRKLERNAASVWITPTLLNAWSADSTNPPAYRKKDDLIGFTGVGLNGTTAVGTIIFKLPEGYRPKQESHFACYAYQIADGSYGLVEIIIKVSGDVVVGQGGKSYISFAGVHFTTL